MTSILRNPAASVSTGKFLWLTFLSVQLAIMAPFPLHNGKRSAKLKFMFCRLCGDMSPSVIRWGGGALSALVQRTLLAICQDPSCPRGGTCTLCLSPGASENKSLSHCLLQPQMPFCRNVFKFLLRWKRFKRLWRNDTQLHHIHFFFFLNFYNPMSVCATDRVVVLNYFNQAFHICFFFKRKNYVTLLQLAGKGMSLAICSKSIRLRLPRKSVTAHYIVPMLEGTPWAI